MTVDVKKLHATTDAAVWAAEFVKQFQGHTVIGEGVDSGVRLTVNEGTMIGWFANAIETAKSLAPPDAAKEAG